MNVECPACQVHHEIRIRPTWTNRHCSPCRRAYAAKYRAAHPEKNREANRKYHKTLEPQRRRDKCNRNYARHRARYCKRAKLYRDNNLEKVKAVQQKWRLANKHKKVEQEARRRARMKGNEVEKFSNQEILARDGYRCHICNRKVAKKNLSFDHLIPIFYGGGHTRNNVAVAHKSCNFSRGPGRIPAQLILPN